MGSLRLNTLPKIWLLFSLLILSSCAGLRYDDAKPEAFSLEPSQEGVLAGVTNELRRVHGSRQSGFLLLPKADEALQWRLALLDHAVSSIDVQAFMWKNDEVGRLFLARLIDASRRGVRVRVLIDDLILVASDKQIAAIASLPNFEVRVFNPEAVRIRPVSSVFEYALSFEELNRRMHNKLLVVDGHLAVVGGRNIANEYFGLKKAYNFLDLDVIACGPVVKSIASAFDEYWNSDPAQPGKHFAGLNGDSRLQSEIEKIDQGCRKETELIKSSIYPTKRVDWTAWFKSLPKRMHPGIARFLQDPPNPEDNDKKLIRQIQSTVRHPQKELIIATPYLIPVGTMLEEFKMLNQKGVKVTLMAGAMESTTHTIVNSHYKKYRRPILDTGAQLFEFHSDPSEATRSLADAQPVRAKFVSPHLKAMVSDREVCFIGSLNFDPRALIINTESGLVVESKSLSGELTEFLLSLTDLKDSWSVYLEDGRIRWRSQEGVKKIQPARHLPQRTMDFFYRFIPVEGQL